MPNNIKYLIGLSIVLLHACQDNPVEEFTSGSQSLFSYNGNNNAGKSLLHQLKNHSSLQEDTRVLLNAREELLYDHAMFRSGEVYGLYYLVPVRDKASGVVNKALVYKVDAKADQGKVRLANSLSEVLVLDEAELSQIPAYRRFLYSYPFKQWEDQGLKVLSSLSAYAKKLDGKLVPAETSELQIPKSKVSINWVMVSYEFNWYIEVDTTYEIEIGVLNLEARTEVFNQHKYILDEAFNDDVALDVEMASLRISAISDIASSPNLYEAVSEYMSACDFSFSMLSASYRFINYQITSTSSDLPEEDDNDNNTGGNTGGGTAGGGTSNPGGGTSGTKSPVELIDPEKFVAYLGDGRCWETCSLFLRNYNLPPGDTEHVYQLIVERNGEEVYYDSNYQTTYQNAIACIDRHLDAGRPIMIGTTYKTGYHENNDKTTDHFVVITGRGYDESQGMYYYTYMDSAHQYAEDGCDLKENRLYYDDVNYKFYQNDYRTNGTTQQVTHVRPNDGNTEGTVSQTNLND